MTTPQHAPAVIPQASGSDLSSVTGPDVSVQIHKIEGLSLPGTPLETLYPDESEQVAARARFDHIAGLPHTDKDYRTFGEDGRKLQAVALQRLEAIIDAVKQFECANQDTLIFKITFVLTEVFTNHVLHGNRFDPTKSISIDASITHDGNKFLWLEVTSRDEGKGFKPREVADPTQLDRLENTDGRGLLLMDELSDLSTITHEGRGAWVRFNAPEQ